MTCCCDFRKRLCGSWRNSEKPVWEQTCFFQRFWQTAEIVGRKAHFSWKNNNGWAWRAQNLLILLCSILSLCLPMKSWNSCHVLASRAIERYSPCEFNCIWPTMSICDRENLNTKWLPICQKSLPLQFVFLCLGPAFFSLSSPRLRLFDYFDWLTTGMSCLGQDPVGQNCSRVKVKRRYFPHRDFEIQ